MKHFTRSALTMAAGVAASQSISLLSAPVLTRLYEPETFGLFSAFIVLSGLLSVPATLRYEVAVVLPKSNANGELLAAGAVAVAACMMLCATLGLGLLSWWLGDLHRLHALGPWLLLVPALALCISLHNTALGLANRFRRYRVIVAGTVTQQGVAALSAIALSFAGSSVAGLIFSRFLGYVCAAPVIGVRTLIRGAWSCWRDRSRLRCLAFRYRQFPLFNVPYSLLGLLSRDFPILALTFFGYGTVAGHFALARLAATFPVNLLTSSLTQVFYRDAVDRLGSSEFTDLMWKIMQAVTVGVVPIVLVLAMWSEPLFVWVFGENWRKSGEIFPLLAIPMVFGLLTGWPERVFEVREKQYISLAVQLGFDLAVVLVVTLMLAFPLGPY
jgi:O-antigen/teichoic acid export membrane protein